MSTLLKVPYFCYTLCFFKKKTHFILVPLYRVLIGDTIFASPTGDGTAILCGHPSHAKVQPFAGQKQYLHFSVILRP